MTTGRDKTKGKVKGNILSTKDKRAIERKQKGRAHARTQIPYLRAAVLRAAIKAELQASIITHPGLTPACILLACPYLGRAAHPSNFVPVLIHRHL